MKLLHEKRVQNETACPNCGGEASWVYSDAESLQVEVTCPDCGRIDMSRAEFDCAEADIAGPSERDA